MAEDRKRKFLEKFVLLARERIEALNDALLTLETEPRNEEIATEMMREIHTLKGESRLVQQTEITRLAHQTEDVLLRAREGAFASRELVALGFEGFDLLTALVENAAGEEFEIDVDGFVRRAHAALRAPTAEAVAGATPSTELRPNGDLVAEASTRVRVDERFDSVAASTDSLSPQPDDTMTLSSNPPAAHRASGRPSRSSIPAAERSQSREPSTHLRVDVLKLQSLTDASNSVIPQHRLLDGAVNELGTMTGSWSRELDGVLADLAGNRAHANAEQLRSLLALIETRLASWRQTARQLESQLSRLSEQSFDLGVALRDVRDRVQRIRLLPLKQLFAQYPRAMRDLAQGIGKRVHFQVDGSDVEVDKEVMEALHEPLIHLLGNAIDHGIEESKERLRAGKSEVGTVTLRASSRGAEAEIIIEDDGGGVQIEDVRRLAVLRGVATPQQATLLPDEEVLDFIFMPGFSTRKETTELSGRGIGLNVVRERISELRGSLKVSSDAGVGTTFTLRVPVSSVVTRGLIVRAGDVTYAIDPREIEIVVEYDSEAIESTGAGRTLHIGDRHLPLFDLASLLGGTAEREFGDRARIIVVKYLDEAIAVIADDVLGEREVTQRAFDPFLAASPVAAGTAVVETGAISVLLHAAQLLELAGAPGAAEFNRIEQNGAFDPEEGSGFRVLVVDDSELMRGLLGTILAARGYQVLEAINGAEGISLLSVESADLILADLDMPVLDGFEMIGRLRAQGEYSKTPIIVLSARASAEDRRRAAELGADAFLSKTDFEEEGLCRMIATMLSH